MRIFIEVLTFLTMFFIVYLIGKYWMKTKINPITYLIGIFLFIIVRFFSPLFADELVMTNDGAVLFKTFHEFELYQQANPNWNSKIEVNPKALTEAQRAHYTNERDMHKREYERNVQNIHDACWWAPNIDDRKMGRMFWNALIAAGFNTGPVQFRFIVMMGSMIAQYGLECMDHYDYIHDQQLWAAYHAEQYEWYQNVLNNA